MMCSVPESKIIETVKLSVQLKSLENFARNSLPSIRSFPITLNGLDWTLVVGRALVSIGRPRFSGKYYGLSCSLFIEVPNDLENEMCCYTVADLHIRKDDNVLIKRQFPREFCTTGYNNGPKVIIPFEEMTQFWMTENVTIEVKLEADKPKLIRNEFSSVFVLPDHFQQMDGVYLAGITNTNVYVCCHRMANNLTIYGTELTTTQWQRVSDIQPYCPISHNFSGYSASISYDTKKIGVLAIEKHSFTNVTNLCFHLVDIESGNVDHWPVDLTVDFGRGGPSRFGNTTIGWIVFDDNSVAYVIGPDGLRKAITKLPPCAYQIRITFNRIFCLQTTCLLVFDLTKPDLGWCRFESHPVYPMDQGVLCSSIDMNIPIFCQWRLDGSGTFTELMLDENTYGAWGHPFVNLPESHPGSILHNTVQFGCNKMAYLKWGQQVNSVKVVHLGRPTFRTLKELAGRAVQQYSGMTERQLRLVIGYKATKSLFY